MFLGVLLFLTQSMAAQEGLFTYQAQVIAHDETLNSCAAEADAWAQRFALATKTQLESATCRSERELTVGNKTYKVYNLGLRYKSKAAYQPYKVQIGRDESLSSSRLHDEPIYPNLESCFQDMKTQADHYQHETQLKVVTTTCAQDPSSITRTSYYLQIEGFGQDKYFVSQPQKRLYVFSPFQFENLPAARQIQARNFLSKYGAHIVKEAPGTFVYYRSQNQVPVRAESLGTHRNDFQCTSQIDSALDIFTRAGSQDILAWCHDNRLVVLYEGYFYLNQYSPSYPIIYSRFEDCIQDQGFVLSDIRHQNALGAICSPSLYDRNTYKMDLFRSY